MASKRSSLMDVVDAPRDRLDAVESFVGKRPVAERPRWVTPSIQLTEDHLHLLRTVAQARAGRGRVSISAVVQQLIDDSQAKLEREVRDWQDGKRA